MGIRSSLVTRAAAAGLAVAALGACGAEARLEPAEILRASVTSRAATQVTVTFVVSPDPNCGGFEGADVQDDEATATVAVLVTLRATAQDCRGDGMETRRTLTLAHPLGDRRLVDRSTGRTVEVAVVP